MQTQDSTMAAPELTTANVDHSLHIPIMSPATEGAGDITRCSQTQTHVPTM